MGTVPLGTVDFVELNLPFGTVFQKVKVSGSDVNDEIVAVALRM